jgi:hypothetical protein
LVEEHTVQRYVKKAETANGIPFGRRRETKKPLGGFRQFY